ncbi:MAG: membrane-bound lytic murein transglycosylase MltF [Sideroxydans sp.]|nr:membrane-bound lytic murein transglycosylase MltF [Sideroxydans sp.]
MSLLPLRLAVVIGLLAWLSFKLNTTTPLPDWRQGELVVIVPNSEMDVEAAFETDLIELFAKQLNVKPRFLQLTSDEAIAAMNAGRAHLMTSLRVDSNRTLRFSHPYQTLEERVICNDNTPRKIEGLFSRQLIVSSDSAQVAALHLLHDEYENLAWEVRKKSSPIQLLQEMADGKLDCTVANEEQIATMRNFYPSLGAGLSLQPASKMSWAIDIEGDDALLEAANRFLDGVNADNSLRQLIDRHYGHNDRLGSTDTTSFLNHTRQLLPHYRQWFNEAAEITGLDWRLIAALAYRESRWDPNATSFTKVRGMMMLTEDTADRMGVKNRLDPQESIMAGARYLQMIKEQLPLRIAEQDRIWLALAAYNQGLGHLEDARVLAVRSGLNPDVWSDVKRVMPLLSKAEYFDTVKHGQARGGEAVIHVETVRLYHDMLIKLDEQNELGSPQPATQYGLLGLVKNTLGLHLPR